MRLTEKRRHVAAVGQFDLQALASAILLMQAICDR